MENGKITGLKSGHSGGQFCTDYGAVSLCLLLSRAAFEQSGAAEEVLNRLVACIFAVLELVYLWRPAIAAGTAIVMMETINDFAVDYFAVQTLTTGIFSVCWKAAMQAGRRNWQLWDCV